MAFFPESSASCLGQMTSQSCLYSSAHPGLLAYNTAATNQNIYLAEKMKMQTQGLMMPRLTAMSAYSHGLYQQSIATANSVNFNEHSWFPSIAMALDAGQSTSKNMKPAIHGANFRSGYQDERNLKQSSTLAHPFYWRKRGNSVPTEGMTRTRDKYRVVYTEKQRVGLEKEFKTNKFITMQRKIELSKELDLSERQVLFKVFHWARFLSFYPSFYSLFISFLPSFFTNTHALQAFRLHISTCSFVVYV